MTFFNRLFRLGVLVLLACVLPASVAQSQVPREYELKAAFLYNFTKYVDGLNHAGQPRQMVLGVLGVDPFLTRHRSQLERLGVDVIVFADIAAVKDFAGTIDVLFVPSKGRNAATATQRLTDAVEANKTRKQGEKPFLLVTEVDRGTQVARDRALGANRKDAMINFWIDPTTRLLKMDVYHSRFDAAGFKLKPTLRNLPNYVKR